jgi:hypothetical protein
MANRKQAKLKSLRRAKINRTFVKLISGANRETKYSIIKWTLSGCSPNATQLRMMKSNTTKKDSVLRPSAIEATALIK